MALPLGKITILVGAGIVGSVLAKEGRLSNVPDFFSGAFKIVLKQIRQDDSTPSSAKPRNDTLLAQVNNLRQELQLLASNRSVTIVTSSGSGASRYGIIIVVVVVGYGYVWWKGWKLPDMMFATRRGLSDACTTIAKQLENVYSSISVTKRHLSSRIDRVDCSLDECAELTSATREEVSELQGEMKVIGVDVQSVHHAVRTLETKINRIEGKQDLTNDGVRRLVDYAWSLENSRTTERIQATPSSSSRPAIELPQMTPSSRTESSPPVLSLEPPSPSASNGSHKVQRPLQSAVSASGLKELHGISVVEGSSSPEVSNGVHVTEDTKNGYSGAGLFGRKLPGIGASFLTRTRSAMQSFK
uniref:Putative B-zip transcription factor n=1 Tax=Davidia involucrata TaxID=16924 RepID=A0A5B6ZKU1_DAVIN